MNFDLFFQIFKGSVYEFWWLIFPIVFFVFFAFILNYFRELKSGNKEVESLVFVELVFSEKVLQRPIKLMENVIEDLVNISFKDNRISFEVVCTNNHLRYFIGVPKENKRSLEILIYSQYPQLRVVNEDNYLSSLPPVAFSKHVNFSGKQIGLKKTNLLSVLTYENFKGVGKEDKKTVIKDPYSILMELFSRVGYDDIFCLHIIIQNIDKKDKEVLKKEIEDEKNKMQGIIKYTDIVSVLFNKLSPQKEPKELTDKDKGVIEKMKKKADSKLFKTSLSYGYFSPDEENKELVEGIVKIFFNNYEQDNSFAEIKPKKASGLFAKQREEVFKKKLIKETYLNLLNRRVSDNCIYLSSEEVVSLFHFPLQNIDFVSFWGQTSRGIPPSDLPIFK
jgi:hypothetical protein